MIAASQQKSDHASSTSSFTAALTIDSGVCCVTLFLWLRARCLSECLRLSWASTPNTKSIRSPDCTQHSTAQVGQHNQQHNSTRRLSVARAWHVHNKRLGSSCWQLH